MFQNQNLRDFFDRKPPLTLVVSMCAIAVLTWVVIYLASGQIIWL